MIIGSAFCTTLSYQIKFYLLVGDYINERMHLVSVT